MLIIVLISLLLDRDIGKMDVQVVHINGVISVLYITKSSKTFTRKPYFQWSIARDKYIDSQVELFGANQKRSIDVSRDHVTFHPLGLLKRQFGGVRPLL